MSYSDPLHDDRFTLLGYKREVKRIVFYFSDNNVVIRYPQDIDTFLNSAGAFDCNKLKQMLMIRKLKGLQIDTDFREFI